jgi:regulator of protease activity HflC (stomatin/prohibitin superfamily)
MVPERAAYQVANLPRALTTLAMTNIRAVIGEMELDATLSSRERINTSLLVTLDGATEPWGVKVSRVEIRKIEPPANLVQAMNLQMTAERERRAVVARADGEREAAIKRAEGEKQALVLAAEGRQQAAVRDAQARIQLAQAEAEATRMVSEAAATYGPAALQYFIADRYVGAFRAIAASPASRLVVVPMEAAGFAGGIAQALQILRTSDGPWGGPPAAPPPPAGLASAPATLSAATIPSPAGPVPASPAPPSPAAAAVSSSSPWGSQSGGTT